MHKSELPKAIIFDRDGTLIVDKKYLNDHKQVEFIPGVIDAMLKLKAAGYLFFVATNQSGIPRGLVTVDNLNAIHSEMDRVLSAQNLKIMKYYYAPYMPSDDQIMRKPNPGMLLKAAEEFRFALESSWMIGDRMSDVEAGHRAGTRAILLNSNYHDEGQEEWPPPEAKFADLTEATEYILQRADFNQ